MSSNSGSNFTFMCDKFLQKLSCYKRVDSAEKYTNNIGKVIGYRFGSDWLSSKLDFIGKYRF